MKTIYVFKNMLNGQTVELFKTTDHPQSSYNQEVWVDEEGNCYGQCNLTPVPSGFQLLSVKEDQSIDLLVSEITVLVNSLNEESNKEWKDYRIFNVEIKRLEKDEALICVSIGKFDTTYHNVIVKKDGWNILDQSAKNKHLDDIMQYFLFPKIEKFLSDDQGVLKIKHENAEELGYFDQDELESISILKQYLVSYNGNSSRFKNFHDSVNAFSSRQAVEEVYQKYCDENYFPQEDGSIEDCDGNCIADPNDEEIEFDGGYFFAKEIN